MSELENKNIYTYDATADSEGCACGGTCNCKSDASESSSCGGGCSCQQDS